jgi:hypothetical protein
MITLEFAIEQPIFNLILSNPDKVLILPKETYDKFFKFMIQEEFYEDISKLESIKGRLVDSTIDELIEDITTKGDWVEL